MTGKSLASSGRPSSPSVFQCGWAGSHPSNCARGDRGFALHAIGQVVPDSDVPLHMTAGIGVGHEGQLQMPKLPFNECGIQERGAFAPQDPLHMRLRPREDPLSHQFSYRHADRSVHRPAKREQQRAVCVLQPVLRIRIGNQQRQAVQNATYAAVPESVHAG